MVIQDNNCSSQENIITLMIIYAHLIMDYSKKSTGLLGLQKIIHKRFGSLFIH